MDVLISQGFLYRLALFVLVAVAYVYCIYLGHAWQEQKSREGGDFLRAANTTPEGWRFAERRKYYPTFTSATDKP